MMVFGQAGVQGAFFCFVATVLLVFVSVSSPTWERVSFLCVTSGAQSVHFGVFGHTGTSPHIGYTFDLPQFNFHDSTLAKSSVLNLTNALILHPIAAGLSGIAFLFGLYDMRYHHLGTVLMSLTSGLTALLVFVAWIIGMALFGTARTHFRDHGLVADYGNANWLTVGALAALVLAFVTSTFGASGSYRRKKSY